ncbi:MAG: hypothetical protein IJR55_00905 [Clostridia bacterium]|nr:hypothetical protein [Clostridia bacterium]
MKITKEMGVILPDTTITAGEPIFLDVTKKPFELYGFAKNFRRLPDDVAEATSVDVERISRYSPGCRLRFKTNSDYIVVHAELGIHENIPTMTTIATTCFDVYFYDKGNYVFKGSFWNSQGEGKSYVEGRIRFENFDEKDVVIDFPIVSEIKEMYVALREGCEIDSPSKYKLPKPIVVYGSSIVQGIGAGRPGTLYSAELSRRFDADVINLGFGGSAKAEKPIMEYMAGLDMCAFVYDYDHNAPTPEYLKETHYNGYKIIREKNPDLPIIMASKPDYHFANVETNEKRRRIIIETFERAKAEGDGNVWFVDGSKMYPEELREACSADGCHPNDVGFLFMANAFTAALKEALTKHGII